MTLGKKELMAAVVVGIAVLAAAVHFLIFQKKAKTYDSTSQEYKAAVEQLSNAEFIRDQQAFDQYKQKTTQYSSMVTSVVAELNLQKLDLPTSPPAGAVDQWGSQTLQLIAQVNGQRQGRVKLSFLDKDGWNLPAQLPAVGGAGALADRVSQLNQVYQQLQFTKGQPSTEYNVRKQYNQSLGALGINPQETSKFYYPQGQQFFNSEDWINAVLKSSNAAGTGANGTTDLRPYYNQWGLQRFGIAIPALKKIWIYGLVKQNLQTQNADTTMLTKFGEALEIGIPLGGDEPLNSINKQLQALLDIIDIAGKTGVKEIVQVKFLRPVNVAKAVLRKPGETPSATPAPVATPDPMAGTGMIGMGGMDLGMMGMGGPMNVQATVTPVPDAERVGIGAGIELSLRADNANLTNFYYELSHVTRTYGIDDLYVYNTPQGLYTTATVEVITDVNLQGGSATGAAPGEGAAF